MKCRKAYAIIPVGENDRSAHVAQQKAPEVATPGLFYSVLGGWLNPKAGYQLFFSVQPFADVVGKGHIHTHFIVNSVNYEDGHKLQWSKHDLKDLKERCNEQSREQGLHVPEKGKTFAGEVREEILRYYFLRQPQRVIGACIGRSRSTAGRHIQLALQRLREEMGVSRYESMKQSSKPVRATQKP